MDLPRLPGGGIDWQKVENFTDVCDWLAQIDDLNATRSLNEQPGLYAFLAGQQARIDESIAKLSTHLEAAEKEQALNERLVREEQEEQVSIALAEAMEAARARLTEQLGKQPAQGTIDAEARRDEAYLTVCQEAREARRKSLVNESLIKAKLQLAALTRTRDELKGVLKAIVLRQDGLTNAAYDRRQEMRHNI
jgi:hypothetical protein